MSTLLLQPHNLDLEAGKCENETAEINNVVVVVVVNDEKDEEKKRVSNVSECSVEEILDLESGELEKEQSLGERSKRDCRICHLSMDLSNQESEFSIELGCCCKNDLSAAHKQCAETWFKIKGNKTCEICGSIAQNVVGVPDPEPDQLDAADDAVTTARTLAPHLEARNFWQGHRFLNLLLACMVFAFVISWLFHFSVPSPRDI